MVPGPPGVWLAADVVTKTQPQTEAKGLIATECSYRGAGGLEVPQCGPGTIRRGSRGRSTPEAEGCEVGRGCPLPTGESGRGLGRGLITDCAKEEQVCVDIGVTTVLEDARFVTSCSRL